MEEATNITHSLQTQATNATQNASNSDQSLQALEENSNFTDPLQLNVVILETPPRFTEEEMRRQAAAFYTILMVMMIAQMLLVWWRAKHRRSYELVTLIGLWLVPVFWSLELGFWRFVSVWLIYSSITIYILCQCLTKTVASSTPRLVYTWFLGVFKLSVGIGICGYCLIFLEAFGVGSILRTFFSPTISIEMLWYGLYYGILGRDCAEVASDWLQSRLLGGGRRLAVQPNKCGICNKDLGGMTSVDEVMGEKIVTLDCKHRFHEHCIRGWTIVGKKDVCPTCLEKVDLKSLYSNRPWGTSNLSWIKMLDAVRYLVAWHPVILVLLHFSLHFFGVDRKPESQQNDVTA